jgi:hypothetical protein
MDSRLEQFRAGAAMLGAARRGRKFTKELIALGAAHVAVRRAQNAAWHTIAEELDVSVPTVQRWSEQPASVAPGFRSVSVVENQSSERYAAVLPGGLRLEGLSLEAVVALARRLA